MRSISPKSKVQSPKSAFIVRHSSFIIHRSSFSVRAMTLIEILTAMMVTSLLIGTAFSTFWVATQSWDKAKRRTEMFRLLDGTADLVTRYLRTIQPPFIEGGAAFVAYNDSDDAGDYDSIAFVCSGNPRSPSVLAMSDLCEIEFYIDAGETGEEGEATGATETEPTARGERSETGERVNRGLWMRIDPTPDEDLESGGYLTQLSPQITSFDVQFFDGAEWTEEWLNTTAVPEAVEFSLTVTDPEGRENPMTLTRLVYLSTAVAVNDGTMAGSETYQATGYSTYTDMSGPSESSGSGGFGGPSGNKTLNAER